MTDKLETVEADTTTHEVMKIMATRKIRSVLVKPKDVDDIPGVITVRDLVYKVIAKDLDPKEIKAADIATKPLIYVTKGIRIEYATKLMDALNINRVFIKNEEEIVGVVALSDIIKAVIKEQDKKPAPELHLAENLQNSL
jgi:CBS domain-containing protein